MVQFVLRIWYDAVIVGGMNPGPPALQAITLPLGYRGGGDLKDYDHFHFRNIKK